MRMASITTVIGFLLVGTGNITSQAAEYTYLGPVTWSEETVLQVLSRDHRNIEEVKAPEGKVFLVFHFAELPSVREITYDAREFKFEVEGESGALRAYGIANSLFQDPGAPSLFSVKVSFKSFTPDEDTIFWVAYLVPASANQGVLTVRDVRNSVNW